MHLVMLVDFGMILVDLGGEFGDFAGFLEMAFTEHPTPLEIMSRNLSKLQAPPLNDRYHVLFHTLRSSLESASRMFATYLP